MQNARKVIPASLALLLTILALAACSSEPAVQRDSSESGPATASETGATSGEEMGTVGSTGTVAPAATTGPAVVIQSQEVDATPGLVAEMIEAKRKEGVLTIKVRFRNTGSESAWHNFETGHGDYSLFYVTAGDQKFLVLKDTEGAPLAPKYLNVSLETGQTLTWWAKFPAPPAGEATFDLIIPDIPPFEDIPITSG